jgi:aryl-alcohol dehydrogenase-like predicted oxidoreductase
LPNSALTSLHATVDFAIRPNDHFMQIWLRNRITGLWEVALPGSGSPSSDTSGNKNPPYNAHRTLHHSLRSSVYVAINTHAKLDISAMTYGQILGVRKPVSRLIQGTVMVSSDFRDESFALLDGVFELGGNAFDTAHVYGGGDNERTVGQWVRDRGVRDQVVVIGKGAHPYGGRNRVTPNDIVDDIRDSLDRFGFDSIDLYLLHRDDESVPVGEIVDALHEHREKGHINAFGGSNWSHLRIEAANDYAARAGKTPFSASSPQFGLCWPQKPVWEGCLTIGSPDGKEAVEYYRNTQIPVLPWSSLGGGIFSGRITPENLNSFEDYFDKLCAECYGHGENFLRLQRARELAQKKGVTPAQIGLAWVFGQGLNVFPLVGCATPIEFAENAKALALELASEENRWLANV